MKNTFNGVKVGNEWCEEPSKVKEVVKDFFENRFTGGTNVNLRLDNVVFPTINREDNDLLINHFSDEEIKAAVWDCENSKSPGPNGFNFNFFKQFWDIIKTDLIKVVKCFHSCGRWPKGCNASFISLIPKVDNPQGLEEYRPISLVESLYKIISKILSKRMQKVLHKIIDKKQSAFIKDRSILDSVVVINEVIEEVRRKKGKCIIIKADFEKAYDSVNWEFLLYMLERMGFCPKWVKWIRSCLESFDISILINGSPTGQFTPTKGLRQGDPLVPFLFLIVAQGLAGVVTQAESMGLIKGIRVGHKQIPISMLQFVDDTIFVCNEEIQNIMVIKSILRCFEIASGLKVNFHKSKIGSIGIHLRKVERFSAILNCSIMKVPFKYLGIPVGANHRRIEFWQDMIQKIQKRLALWKGKYLSFAGRVTLIKSVLSTIPLYYLSLFKLPICVEKMIRKIQSDFLWGWGHDGRKIAWIKWDHIVKLRKMVV